MEITIQELNEGYDYGIYIDGKLKHLCQTQEHAERVVEQLKNLPPMMKVIDMYLNKLSQTHEWQWS